MIVPLRSRISAHPTVAFVVLAFDVGPGVAIAICKQLGAFRSHPIPAEDPEPDRLA